MARCLLLSPVGTTATAEKWMGLTSWVDAQSVAAAMRSGSDMGLSRRGAANYIIGSRPIAAEDVSIEPVQMP
jgi:hypothetical protein